MNDSDIHPWNGNYEAKIREKYKPHPNFWGRYELFFHTLVNRPGCYHDARNYAMDDNEVDLLVKLVSDQFDIMAIQWNAGPVTKTAIRIL